MGQINNPTPGLKKVDTVVFNGNSPGVAAWTDLDLSSVVGVAQKAVMLRITSGNGGSIGFRTNGDTTDYYETVGTNSNVASVAPTTAIYDVAIVVTDSNGIIEWKSELLNQATVIVVIAYW